MNFTRSYNHQTPTSREDGKVSVEPGWWAWGQHVELYHDDDDQPCERAWVGFIRLANLDGDTSERNFELDSFLRGDIAGGTSNFIIDQSMKEPRISLGFNDAKYILHRGENDRLAAIELREIRASTAREAIEIVRVYFSQLSAFLIFALQLPLRYHSVCVHPSDESLPAISRVYSPWPDVRIQPASFRTDSLAIIFRLMLTYAEGVMSSSVAYQFFNFYKIVDHIITHGNALRNIQKERYQSASWTELNDKLPDEPTKYYDANLVGKKYTIARDRYRDSELRNAVGHILETESHFEPLDPVHAGHYRAAGTICRIMAHHLIRIVGANAAAMASQGATVEEMLQAFYPSTK